MELAVVAGFPVSPSLQMMLSATLTIFIGCHFGVVAKADEVSVKIFFPSSGKPSSPNVVPYRIVFVSKGIDFGVPFYIYIMLLCIIRYLLTILIRYTVNWRRIRG